MTRRRIVVIPNRYRRSVLAFLAKYDVSWAEALAWVRWELTRTQR